jgi:hypothetical protein
MKKFVNRDRACRRCGSRYTPGYYDEHTRGLTHQRQLVLDRKIARGKRAEEQKRGREVEDVTTAACDVCGQTSDHQHPDEGPMWVTASDGFIGYAHLLLGDHTECGIPVEDVTFRDPEDLARYSKCESCEDRS